MTKIDIKEVKRKDHEKERILKELNEAEAHTDKRPFQERFFELLEKIPFLKQFYNYDLGELDEELIEKNFISKSKSEKVLLKFLIIVYSGQGKDFPNEDIEKFDMWDGMFYLDWKNKKVIADWVKNPYTHD